MTPEELRDLAYNSLDAMKAIDIVVLDVRSLTTITDYMIVCTGTSTRHVTSLAEELAFKAKHANVKPIHTEGGKEGEWVLVDMNDVVVHVMLASTRAFYSIEDLWEPVRELRDDEIK